METLEALAKGLSEAQRRCVRVAECIDINDDPAKGYVVLDDGEDPLPPRIADDITGVLTPEGIALRAHLLAQKDVE
jgi:hypothetical protein